jgi:hypothetical protein
MLGNILLLPTLVKAAAYRFNDADGASYIWGWPGWDEAKGCTGKKPLGFGASGMTASERNMNRIHTVTVGIPDCSMVRQDLGPRLISYMVVQVLFIPFQDGVDVAMLLGLQ